MCLSQEAPAKQGGSGRVPKEPGCPWDWGSSELGAVEERGVLGGQGGEWVDGCPREKGRNLSGLRTNPWLPTQHPAWADRVYTLLSCCLTAQLCTHIAPRFQKENTLLYLHKENWELLPAHWFAPFSVADGPGSSHPWHRSR